MDLLQAHFNPFAFWLQTFGPAAQHFAPLTKPPALPVCGAMQQCGSYNLFVPQGLARRRAMVVMLHGAAQSADDFAAGTAMNDAAQRHGMIALYPNQGSEADAHRCWHWFDRNDQLRDARDVARIVELTLLVAKQHAVDASRIYVAGLSAGGAMATLLGHLFPELYAAVGVHSGLAVGSASDLSSALSAMRAGAAFRPEASEMPTIVFHGDRDSTVHPINGLRLVESSIGVDGRVESQEECVCNGRLVTRQTLKSQAGTACEHWLVHGAGHAWSGGSLKGSFTDTAGPDASEEMLRFFEAARNKRGIAVASRPLKSKFLRGGVH